MNTLRFQSRHVHLMGIGGAGMSALVPLLRQVGAVVDGCDLADSERGRHLASVGVPVALGHDVAHVAGCDILIHTSAVSDQHAEVRAARAAGVEVLSRPVCLAELVRGCRTLAVAGSHGKTTTSWMLGHLLTENGHDPVAMIGGTVAHLGGGGRIGHGEIFVTEVDESDAGFRHIRPDIAVITNLEAEHLRQYGSFGALCDSFNAWLVNLEPSAVWIADSGTLDPRIGIGVAARRIAVGLDRGDVHARDLRCEAEGSRFGVIVHGTDRGEILIPSPGVHNVRNALAAIAAATVVDPACDLTVLASCERVGRRFTVHGSPGGIRVVEDYGHHPTEVRAAVAAARLGSDRVHVIFQPHRYSRTCDCFHDFVGAFDEAMACVVLPVYAAGEDPIAGASGRDLAEAIAAHRAEADRPAALTQYVGSGEPAVDFIAAHARSGDTCLVLGAGDVGRLAPRLVEALTP